MEWKAREAKKEAGRNAHKNQNKWWTYFPWAFQFYFTITAL